ncbi:zinc finger FYVE domain-containing protein 16 isoform X2 [Eucyclogobius newberryi]|uniref:zinc finger FYVE domain-containing protein 16 isoform X2 n=1 Tax=Eucyclogobius newberryi TaxID=166745 RepID=UPI003B599D32
MDSFFKSAVCDLDKLLDDFELSSELECNPVFLKPTICGPFSPATSSCSSSETSAVSTTLPDLNSLHYDSPSPFPDRLINHNHTTEEGEGNVQPLTCVDLLSSVNRRQAKSSAPPCPDRALKPVCDLVNDTSSAILMNSNDAFSELHTVDRQIEPEEALLVHFDQPFASGKSLGGNCDAIVSECHMNDRPSTQKEELSESLYLTSLDIILPLATEQSCESVLDSFKEQKGKSVDCEELESSCQTEESSLNPCEEVSPQPVECMKATEPSPDKKVETDEYSQEDSEAQAQMESHQESSKCQPISLSCLPIVSMCGALVNHNTVENDYERSVEPCDGCLSECTEAKGLSTVDHLKQSFHSKEPSESFITGYEADARLSEYGASTDKVLPDCPETSPVDPPEFGFEYLPESDQAEMLVTDEELDAFLQAHCGEEEVTSVSCLNRPFPDDESMVMGEEGIICSQENGDYCLASPESDRTTVIYVEGNSIDGSPSDHSSSPGVNNQSTTNTFQSHFNSSTEHGGARPKILNCQTSRPDLPAEGEQLQNTTGSTSQPGVVEIKYTSPTMSSSTEETADLNDSSTQDHDSYCAGFDELSEPPPYPGEAITGSVQCADWKREDEEEELGNKQPAWMPDSEAPNCINCDQKFTFTRRRHHCRACGKVYCGVCCNRKCKLKYLQKEARVCVICFDSIHRAQALERMMSPTGPSPNPNVPSEYCSTIPPLQQARAAGTLNSPPPTVMVPVSVLKQPTNESCPREQKRVWFADGILPNGEFADTAKLSVTSRKSGEFTPDQTPSPAESDTGSSGQSASELTVAAEIEQPLLSGPWDFTLLSAISSSVKMIPSLLPDNVDELPPLLITTGETEVGDILMEERPAPCQILHLLEEGGPRPLMFVLNANLLVNVKIVTYGSRQCWCFGSTGLQALGQKELVFLMECLPDEKTLPQDLFTLYFNIYQDAQKGKFIDDLDNITFTSSFLGSKDHAGMLFFSPSCQLLDGLSLPPQPFLFGLLIQKLEVPWAKVFPLRLLLRLGSEFGVYPTPLPSVRFRDTVYRETGHTIMNLLSDLRNYQYSLPVVEGLRIHMEMGCSHIDIPKSSFNEMLKVVNSSNEHVISVGANFSPEADSHLVCFQNEDGNYQTQANSMPGKTRTVTGASFVVFNGALKPSSGFKAKSSIVEDGLMVQIPPETMESFRLALREQRDFDIPCGKTDGTEIRETVTVRWINWSAPVNKGKTSGVDGKSLDGVHSMRVQQDTVFESDGRSIRCTEVFCQLKSPDTTLVSVLASCSGFQKDIALATCGALTPHLSVLMSSAINSLSLRVSTQADMVEYQAGSRGRLLPQRYMNELDSALIPVIHGGSSSVPQTAMDMEFVFFITYNI